MNTAAPIKNTNPWFIVLSIVSFVLNLLGGSGTIPPIVRLADTKDCSPIIGE